MDIPAATIQLLRSLKGPPLSVYLALWLSDDLMGHCDLVSATGWSKNRVTEALKMLQLTGLVENVRRIQGWSLTASGRNALLNVDPIQHASLKMRDSISASPQKGDSQEDNLLLTTPTDLFLPFKGSSSKEDSSQKESQLFEANLAALARYGVKQNKRTLTLAGREDITPQLIEKHHKRLLHRRHYEPGLLVTTLEANDVMLHEQVPLPERVDPDENRFRYIEGEFGHIGDW